MSRKREEEIQNERDQEIDSRFSEKTHGLTNSRHYLQLSRESSGSLADDTIRNLRRERKRGSLLVYIAYKITPHNVPPRVPVCKAHAARCATRQAVEKII